MSWSSEGYDAGLLLPSCLSTQTRVCLLLSVIAPFRLLRLQTNSLPITVAVPGLPVWTGNW